MSDYDGFGQGSSADNGEAEADNKARAEVAMCISMFMDMHVYVGWKSDGKSCRRIVAMGQCVSSSV